MKIIQGSKDQTERLPAESDVASRPRPASIYGDTPMLVLSRKKNESIVINKDITITVVEMRGDKVRLGIEAPKEIRIDRQEVHQAIEREILNRKPAA